MTAFLVFWLWIWGGVSCCYIISTIVRPTPVSLAWMLVTWPVLIPVNIVFGVVSKYREGRP